MSEFKLTGDFYVSDWNGDPLNDGTNPTTPYAHPADVPVTALLIILGTGIYIGGWSNFVYKRMFGDGKVIIDALGGFGGFHRGATETYNLSQGSKNLHLKNFSPVVLNALGSSSRFHFYNSIFENCTFGPLGSGTQRFVGWNNIFINCPSIFHSGLFLIYNSIVENTSIATVFIFSYSFLSKNSTLFYSGTSLNLNNNLINGKVNISGVEYELKFLSDGSPRPDANPLIPDLINVFPDVYTTGNNFAGDPKFIDVINTIVAPNSDLLKRSNITGFIGGVKPGKTIPVNSNDPDVSITTSQIDTSDPNAWLVDTGFNEGFITITYNVSPNITEIQPIYFDGLLSFDGSEAGGSVGNNNVPDIFPTSYSPLSQGGLKPNRLTYELRTSQSINMPTLESQWDNDSAALGTTPGQYYIQEWNTKPTIVTVAGVRYGNGNPESIGGVANGINVRWAQVKVRLTNNRAF